MGAMIEEQTIPKNHLDLIRRVSQIAASSTLEELLDLVLDLVLEMTGAQAAAFYLYHEIDDMLVLETGKGGGATLNLVKQTLSPGQGMAGLSLQQGKTVDNFPSPWDDGEQQSFPTGDEHFTLRPHYCVPLLQHDQPVGVIWVFAPLSPPPEPHESAEQLEQLNLLGLLIPPHICRTRQLVDAQRREKRLKDLIDIISFMSAMLDRGQLLDDIMIYIQDLLQVEATSIWLKDDITGDLVLHVATGEQSERIREVRVPANQGIIGNVTSTGKSVIVNDVSKDVHFYAGVDQQSGFKTRSIMCVPLKAPRIQLGDQRGELLETIIGGAQALNKRDGSVFTREDTLLLELLAGQAAIILQLSDLYSRLSQLNNELAQSYNETRKMFSGFINGITSFIDRKDPYTRGHSQRVSEFAVAIARQLNRSKQAEISEEMLDHIRIGGILHDVGKIGVADEVLKKPDHLTEEEMEQMRMHPIYGIELLKDSDLLRLLPIEQQAIEEHHERLDGSGYPRGLCGIRTDGANGNGNGTTHKEGISLIGRIVAVADAFDAMASDRPYRVARSAEQAIEILRGAAGTEFDPMCVEALVQARQRGIIRVQHERGERG
jgi:HD-GYP domain-containing protein (c-di-GMP phosphodiesterase class II)